MSSTKNRQRLDDIDGLRQDDQTVNNFEFVDGFVLLWTAKRQNDLKDKYNSPLNIIQSGFEFEGVLLRRVDLRARKRIMI
jgi:hypothetical protein